MTLPDAHTLGLFVAATLAMTLTPGPAVLYVVARRTRSGEVNVAGIAGRCWQCGEAGVTS